MADLFSDTVDHRRAEVKQAVKSAADGMRAEGVQPRDYVEQLSWLFFLKAFEEAENAREEEAAFSAAFEGDGGPAHAYARILQGEVRWPEWTKRKPDDMLAFVNGELFPHLRSLAEKEPRLQGDPLAERFRRIFSEVKNHQSKGSSFARVVEQVDRLSFSSETDVDTLSEIYERLLQDVAQVSGYAGEFYTPRHIIRAMVQVVKPRLGDRVYDPCFGSGGFLFEAAAAIREHAGMMSGDDLERFRSRTVFGRELGALPYLIGTMNLILHGIPRAQLELVNTLEVHDEALPEKAKYDVVLANPPYGGMLAETPRNFNVPSKATETLFLQHIMKSLARGGRAAVVVPEGVLFRHGPDLKVRRRLVDEFRLHAVLSLPAGVFLPYTGVKTNVLFFDRPEDGRTTGEVFYYELENDGFELKTTRKPQPGSQLPDFLARVEKRETDEERAWTVSVEAIRKNGYDLSARNPHRQTLDEHVPAHKLVSEIKTREERILDLLGELEELLEGGEA